MADPKQERLQQEIEKAVILGLVSGDQTLEMLMEYFDELTFLASTAGARVVKQFYQKLSTPNSKTYVGSGKLIEIANYIKTHEIDLAIIDDELSPSQQNHLEKTFECKVIDRSMLILDIFALRAKTVQAKTQVELAQMQYLLPRLRGMWSHLDRIKGGIGMRGAGEKEIETDRRVAKYKINQLKLKLKQIDVQNKTRRKNRGELIRVALVGYTNAGKSTIMNLLSKSAVFAENKLFATVDTTVRKVVLDSTPFLLSDTVGFIRKLPHHLIESFKSTLDESRESDILLHVVDLSHPHYEDQLKVVLKTLQDINASNKTIITIYNKVDLYKKKAYDEFMPKTQKDELFNKLQKSIRQELKGPLIFISASKRINIDTLKNILLKEVIKHYRIRYPYKHSFY